VLFSHSAPAGATAHRQVFGVRVDFGQEFNGIVCLSSELDAALPTYEPGMDTVVHQFLNARLAESEVDPAHKVRQLVRTLLPTGDCTLERVAQQLGIDRRTVHRRLEATGHSFTQVVDAVRIELVQRYVNGKRPLSDVATLLGFASLSAFSRWFRQRHGCSVTTWRRRQIEVSAADPAPEQG
jgi:AraC-like DNA-binding protein